MDNPTQSPSDAAQMLPKVRPGDGAEELVFKENVKGCDEFPFSVTPLDSFASAEEASTASQEPVPLRAATAKTRKITWSVATTTTTARDDDAAAVTAATDDAVGSGAVVVQPQPQLDPLQTFVQGLVGTILEGLRGFDGSMAWLKRTHSVTAAHLDRMKPGAVPEGTEEFSVAWFGIASAVLHDLVDDGVAGISVLASAPFPLHCEGEAAAGALCATPRDLSVAFVSGLRSIVVDAINGGGCHDTGGGGGRHFSRYSTRSFAFVKEIGEMSHRLMEEHLTEGAHMPPALRGKYSDDTTPIDCREDLSAILTRIADAWVCSFFPVYQHRSRDSAEMAPFVWTEEEGSGRLNLDLFFYCFYSACQQRSLMHNAKGEPRGVVVPTAWMERLLRWSTQAREQRRAGVPGADRPPLPGPIDTFALMTVSPHDPRRHWLSVETAQFQVIPEALYDSFIDFFGCGPKYVVHGPFSLRERCLAVWRPLPLLLFVSFEWSERNETDGALDKYSVEVPVEEALLHSEMREVCHLAWGVAKDEEGVMTDKVLGVWLAAINGADTVRIHCKGLYMLSVKPGPFAVAEEGDGMDVTVQEVMQQLQRCIEQNMPESVEEWREQTSRKVSLSLVLSLHNTNGDNRGNEITGAMEVAARQSGVCGLTNVGNSCYMNGALQCLSNLSLFRTKLLTLPVSHYLRSTVASPFIKLLTAMWSGQHSFVETRELKEQIGNRVKRFAGYQQQDSNEFIEVLLDQLSEETNRVSARSYRQREDSDKAIPLQELSTIFWDNFLENNQSFLPPLFFHQSKTLFTCLTCGECSTVFDNNVTLSVSIKDPPQRRDVTVSVVVELSKADEDGVEAASAHGISVAPWQRPVSSGKTRAYALVNLKAHVLLRPDGTVREQDVQETLRRQLLSNASASSDALRFFGDDAAAEMTADEEEAKARELAARLCVDVRVMGIPDHGRAFAWARVRLASPTAVSPPSPSPSPSLSPPPLPRSTLVPAARVWYFLKPSSLPYDRAMVDTPVWMDELPASCAAPETGEATGIASATGDDTEPYAEHICARAVEVATALLRRIDEDDACEGTPLTAAASATSIDADEPAPRTDLRASDEEAAGVVGAAAAPSSMEREIQVSRRALHRTPAENVFAETSAQGDGCHESPTGSGSAVSTIANIAVRIQYDDSKHQFVPGGRRADSFALHGGSGAPAPPETKCSLEECLAYSMQPDVLRGDDAWFCSRCKEFRETRVHRTLFRLPPCLIMSFKRFKMHTYSADKKSTTVHFPGELDFAPYLDPAAAGLQAEGTKYRLRGVVYHAGSLSFGHYTATAFNDSVQKWVHYNDTHTTMDNSDVPSPNGAYILCFERVGAATAGPA